MQIQVQGYTGNLVNCTFYHEKISSNWNTKKNFSLSILRKFFALFSLLLRHFMPFSCNIFENFLFHTYTHCHSYILAVASAYLSMRLKEKTKWKYFFLSFCKACYKPLQLTLQHLWAVLTNCMRVCYFCIFYLHFFWQILSACLINFCFV